MNTATLSGERYSRGAVVLHWLIAALIALNFALAWIAEDLPKAEQGAMMGNHKAVGILVLAFTVVRIAWRLAHSAPPLLETLKAWEAALARVIHALLYVLMLAIPIAGWGLASAFGKGAPVSIFGLFDVPALPVGQDKPNIGMFHELHEITANLMIALFVLHVVAALKHHWFDRDQTLRRMVPWMK